MRTRREWLRGAAFLGLAATGRVAIGQDPQPKQDDPAPEQPASKIKLPGPPEIPDVQLGPVLRTKPIARRAPGPNWVVVDASPLPRDREGIWVLDFAFKPVRLTEVEIPGKGRKQIHYLYYRVINRSGKPRMLVPQFTLVTDTGQKVEDAVLPDAIAKIQSREDPATPLYGAVDVMGMIPPSTKDGVDDAVFGAAVWDTVDYKADKFQIYVRGLSDAYQDAKTPDGKPYTRYKAIRIDFLRLGDEFRVSEREIRLADPPYDWLYYP